MRKKKIEESQLSSNLTEKSRRKPTGRVIQKLLSVSTFQFPDRLVLQRIFGPWDQTAALYELLSSALKEPGLQFDLIHPVAIERRMISRFPSAGQKCITLEENDLVLSALVKFRPIETDSVVFTGLREIIEALV